jgi:hypothetical protein
MTFKKTFFLLLMSGSLATSPANPSVQERPLAMPLAFQSPEDTVNHYIAPMTEYGEGHRGIDLAAQIGEQVLAPADGEISFVGKVGYRYVISVRFGNSLTASLEPVCSDLSEGTYVLMGESIGLVCEPDPEYVWHCAQTCLHFGTRSVAGYFSPLALIGGLNPSKLVYQARG